MSVSSSPDLRRLIDDFLEYLVVEKSLSVLTVRNYRHYLARFLSWMEENSVPLSPSNIDMELAGRFRLFLANYQDKNGSVLKKSTQTYHVIAIRSFLRYLATRRDLTVLNPDKIDLPKTESRVIEFLNADQLARLLNSPEISNEIGLRDKVILELFFSTGLRVSELTKLNRDQINLDTQEFSVKGKGNMQSRLIQSQGGAIQVCESSVHVVPFELVCWPEAIVAKRKEAVELAQKNNEKKYPVRK